MAESISINHDKNVFRPIVSETDLLDGEVLVKAGKIMLFNDIRVLIKEHRFCNIPGIGEIYFRLISELRKKRKRLMLINIEDDIMIDSDFLVFKYQSMYVCISIHLQYILFLSLSRCGKAPCITSLTADLLRPVAISLSSTLELMFTTFFILAVVPRSWTRALVCPVPKKGDLTLISNYRPISLTETGRKLYELCLLKHLQPLSPLSREQGGFRTARSTIDQVDSLDKLIRESKRQHPKDL